MICRSYPDVLYADHTQRSYADVLYTDHTQTYNMQIIPRRIACPSYPYILYAQSRNMCTPWLFRCFFLLSVSFLLVALLMLVMKVGQHPETPYQYRRIITTLLMPSAARSINTVSIARNGPSKTSLLL